MATRRELEQTSFLYGGNAAFLEELYAAYLADPQKVDPSWRAYFDALGPENREMFERARAAVAPRARELRLVVDRGPGVPAAAIAPSLDSPAIKALVRDHLRVIMLIRAYRVRGHLIAKLDPLGLTGNDYHPELDWRTYGFTEADLDREFYLDYVLGLEKATLRQIVEVLRRTYSGTIGIEFLHIQDPEQKAWIQERVENPATFADVSAEEKREILEQLTITEAFEQFLHVKFPGTKRFGLDGGESTIPALETIIRTAASLGVEEIVLGMAHRGRLNVLANVMGKPYAAIMSEFQGAAVYDRFLGSGDVKYHLGTSTDRVLPDGRTIHLSLTANPSHLEAVNPVVMGKVRAKQRQRGDTVERARVMGLLVHGDAAFIGQGVVHECLEMMQLKGYRIGGVVHLIINNQIGFTTSPHASRSSPYPSDVARGVQCPIFHVNGDDPVAVSRVARLATEFRQRFKKDVVIDLWCYRRHGHNEADEPSFTQPIMYKRIAVHPPVRRLYAERLEREGVIRPGEADELYAKAMRELEAAHEASKSYRPNKADWLEGAWKGLRRAPETYERGSTAVPIEKLKALGEKITELPPGFNVHPRLRRIIQQRREAIRSGENIDWATAEHLAFATLLAEGFAVRLSGEDVGRGTFSQRHAIIYDQETEERYVPLQTIPDDPHDFECFDSHLSEEAVLGYEYGHSLADPNCLTIWEAQFGDFANGAQVYFDQFISSGEVKWLRMSGLVCLLPHGYEGQGPEHSSARIERFLQLYAENNMQICYPSTPANYFHVLRRQLHRDFRKPLICFTPKSLLRHKRCVSSLAEMGPGTSFHRVMWETPPSEADRAVERVILCTGKVYYDLLAAREEAGLEGKVALIRLEQLAPFPEDALTAELARYRPDATYVWCQEEPRNMGAWFFVAPRLENIFEAQGKAQRKPIYAGRKASAATATGYHAEHEREQRQLVAEALGLAG
ncbi:MAG: 2-oxoglutarate dehydrogenase E1 component [Geminicoccaceae bacterium]|nr:2-oxoglutarate dehydrogenase E1 component [Geminicoccaceae bacterium]MCS7268739.1 2-oxoglutarate dehydrogenase E1 component [Geminicoccaceae bacterium]MDW8125845.1 2-oxoglutarate dehydrogenase E1 component [Geminicoccaceae bacterium]MDW8340320.1 2-oxoglutarate dehydrogenase E1 component [Geminicoccaceae bacterium]